MWAKMAEAIEGIKSSSEKKQTLFVGEENAI